jgi:hypothetical protein
MVFIIRYACSHVPTLPFAFQLMLLLCMTSSVVLGFKPIKNIQVAFRDKTYVIRDGCSTAKDLADQFRKVSGETDLDSLQIFCKSKVLKPDDSLSDAGIKPGDKVMVLPSAKDAKGQDVLAMYLFMLSNGRDSFSKMKSSMTEEQAEQIEQLEEMWRETKNRFTNLNRKDVADGLRNGFDMAYHRLRSFWEHPLIRQDLHDPSRIESYRKVVTTNVSPELLKQWRLDDAVKSKENWRREFIRLTSNIIRMGDIILDGILDVLLDVLKGKGASVKYASQSSESAQYDINQQSPNAPDTNPRMDDPSLANDLLYELSESDEEDL